MKKRKVGTQADSVKKRPRGRPPKLDAKGNRLVKSQARKDAEKEARKEAEEPTLPPLAPSTVGTLEGPEALARGVTAAAGRVRPLRGARPQLGRRALPRRPGGRLEGAHVLCASSTFFCGSQRPRGSQGTGREPLLSGGGLKGEAGDASSASVSASPPPSSAAAKGQGSRESPSSESLQAAEG